LKGVSFFFSRFATPLFDFVGVNGAMWSDWVGLYGRPRGGVERGKSLDFKAGNTNSKLSFVILSASEGSRIQSHNIP
jgi:hypothetical protein